jgi:hypothetical protein
MPGGSERSRCGSSIAEARANRRRNRPGTSYRRPPGLLGVHHLRRLPAGRAASLHRLDAVLHAWELAGRYPDILDDPWSAKGQRALRRRPGDARPDRRRTLADRARRDRLLPGRRRRRRHRDLRRRIPRSEVLACSHLRQQSASAPASREPAWPTSSPQRTRGCRLDRRLRRHRRHRHRANSREFEATTTTTRDHAQGPGRPARRGLRRALHERVRGVLGLRAGRGSDNEAADPPSSTAASARRPATRLPRPHRESARCSAARRRHTPASRSPSFAMCPGGSVSGWYFAHPEAALLRGRQDRPRPGRGLRAAQGACRGRGRALAGAESTQR